MATQSNDLPKWVYAEAMRDHNTMNIQLRVAVRAHEGWVKVMDFTNDGWTQTNLPTRRQILENIQHTITVQLAELTLEET